MHNYSTNFQKFAKLGNTLMVHSMSWTGPSEDFLIIITRHRASTSTCWHFAFRLCCHTNEARAPTATRPILHN